jgi:hypothetical protein
VRSKHSLIPPLHRANLMIERSSTMVLILASRTDASRRAWMSFARPRLALLLRTVHLWRSFARSVSPQRKSLLVPAMQTRNERF